MITSTDFDLEHTERFTIQSVSERTITLDRAVEHQHLGETLTSESGASYSLAAEVALMSRNIKVRGGDHQSMVSYGFGGRVLVSSMVGEDNTPYVGKN